jgi:lipid-binding SYLF domain-containing protein
VSSSRRAVCVLAALALPALSQQKETERLAACHDVLAEALTLKEGIPANLLDEAECVVVLPGVKKAALGFGARFGYGAASCRTEQGRGAWGRPLMMGLKGGSFGLQIGGQEVDLVLLFMNAKGIDYLLRNKFTLGADASIAAGPLGRSAEAATDAQMRAEILSYSRSRGLFAGISLEGAVLKRDEEANRHVYGGGLVARDILMSPGERVPRSGQGFIEALETHSPARARR